MTSDNFGPTSATAGPPSPGKGMDMLPHPHPSSMTLKDSTSSRTMSLSTKGSSTTSEFTKRKNWSQRIIEELQDILIVLSPLNSKILFVSQSISLFTNYKQDELINLNFLDLFYERSPGNNNSEGNGEKELFIKDFNESILRNKNLCSYFKFKLKKKNGNNSNSGERDFILFEVTGKPFYTNAKGVPISNGFTQNTSARPKAKKNHYRSDSEESSLSETEDREQVQEINNVNGNDVKICKSFFMMLRPYPSKNSEMLDSFLELKIENEKLRKKLSDIYGEQEEEEAGGGDEEEDEEEEDNEVDGDDVENQMNTVNTDGRGKSGNMDYTMNERGRSNAYANTNTGYPNSNNNNQSGSLLPENRPISAYPHRSSLANSNIYPQAEQLFYNYPSSSIQVANPYLGQALLVGNNAQQQQGYANPQDLMNQMNVNKMNGGHDSGMGHNSNAGYQPPNSYEAFHLVNNPLGNGNGSLPNLQLQQLQLHSNNNNNNNNNNQDDSFTHDNGNNTADSKKQKKPKKQRVDEGEFVCRDCGTVDSPEWRRGPLGPKTLCNAVSI